MMRPNPKIRKQSTVFLLSTVIVAAIALLLMSHLLASDKSNEQVALPAGEHVAPSSEHDDVRLQRGTQPALGGTAKVFDQGDAAYQPPEDFFAVNTLNAQSCPISLKGYQGLYYKKYKSNEVWHAQSSGDCAKVATEILLQLQSSGFTLAKADFLDLYGQAWACVVQSTTNQVYLIALMPQSIGSPRGEANKLNLRIMHLFAPGNELCFEPSE